MTKNLWNFDNSYENLPSGFFRKVHLNPVSNPQYVYFNEALTRDLGFSDNLKDEGLEVFSGNEFPQGASSISQAYMGDQFGNLVMLGDGRAILVGEVLDNDGNRFDIQLKGSGRTPFSRGGDGRAALGPMLKEYLFSEALFALRIPTTRSLAVVTTGENVIRDDISQGAILTRVAKSHLRVGTFQFAAYYRDKEDLKALADYAISRHYPFLKDEKSPYLGLYREVIKNQASLIAKWMGVGFVHGVMNTDNMTISGESIDYGPCAFIDEYIPDSVYSSIDRYGRYAFKNQPEIAFWNLGRLGEAFIALISDDNLKAVDELNKELRTYADLFVKYYYMEMTKKLGFKNFEDGDEVIVDAFLKFLHDYKLDYTNSFVELTFGKFERDEYLASQFKDFLSLREDRLKKQGLSEEEVRDFMKSINPAIIPRNYWVKESIDLAEDGDFSLFDEFLKALEDPFAHSEDQEKFKVYPKDHVHVTYCGT